MKPSVSFVFIAVIVLPIVFAEDASGQEIIIETSADSYDNKFFGEGILQIIASDPDADSGTVEDIQVYMTAEPDSGFADSVFIMVPETTDSSGKFEFFLVHIDAIAVAPSDLDPYNSAGVEGDGSCASDCAPIITFGPGGDLDIQADLFVEVRFEITAGDVEIEASYEETVGVLNLDRDSYGTNSYVYITIIDQDANLNPTQNDEFTVDPDNDPNSDLLVLDGGNFDDLVVFREKGDNTAIFEAKYKLGESISVSSESVALTLFDKANYNANLAAPENDSNNIDEISFIVGNSDGTVNVGGSQSPIPSWDPVIQADDDSYVFGDSVNVTITDQDANVNSDAVDSIRLRIYSGENDIEVIAIEKGIDTGIFLGRFHLASETDAAVGSIASVGSVTIIYSDARPADYSEKIQAGIDPEKDFSLEIDVQLPVKTGIDATSVAAPVATNVLDESGPFTVGTSITLSTSIVNNNEVPQPFLALIEVRDSSGSTVFLALQGGTLDSSGSSDIGVVWQPDQTGVFQIRAFVINDFDELEILSPIAVSEITIS